MAKEAQAKSTASFLQQPRVRSKRKHQSTNQLCKTQPYNVSSLRGMKQTQTHQKIASCLAMT
ncbi:MAG: hypothetical protein JSS98_14870 [Bacteroidetes bacterium]|nr:hypothetical protein [Bacteroidota bacterium]